MKNLLKLAKIISRQKIQNVKILNGSDAKKNDKLFYKLYNYIVHGKVKTDQEAAKILYGTSPSDPRYKQTKAVLKNRMYNSLLFIKHDYGENQGWQEIEFEAQRLLAIMVQLKNLNLKPEALLLAKKIAKKTALYELTFPNIKALSSLMYYSAMHFGDPDKYEEYEQRLIEQNKVLQAEFFLQRHYYNIVRLYINSKSTFDKIVRYAQKLQKEVEQILSQVHSCDATFYGSMILLIAFSGKKHLKRRIQICEDAIEKILQKKFVHQGALFSLTINLALIFLSDRKYEKSIEQIERAHQWTQEGDFNWFKLKETELLVYLHARRYHKASSILEQVVNKPELKNCPAYIKEIWKINQAYIHLLKETGNIPNEGEITPPFKISKFFNEVPIFSKDKRGLNVSILIVQFIFWLNRGNRDRIINSTEALRQYIYNHLKKPHLKRSNLFLKMLCNIYTKNFNPKEIQRKVRKWHNELIKTPLDLNNQPFEIELIPYEDLWKMVSSILEKNYPSGKLL